MIYVCFICLCKICFNPFSQIKYNFTLLQRSNWERRSTGWLAQTWATTTRKQWGTIFGATRWDDWTTSFNWNSPECLICQVQGSKHVAQASMWSIGKFLFWYSYYSGFQKCVISVLKLWGTAPTRSAWNRASSGWPVHGKAGFDDMWGKQSIIVGSSSTSNHQWCQQQIRLGGAGQNAPHRHTWLHEVRTAEHGRDQSGCWLGKGTAQFERWAQQLANKVWFLAQWQFLEFFDIL